MNYLFFVSFLFFSSCGTSDYLFKEKPKTNFEKLNDILNDFKDSSLTYFDFQNLRSNKNTQTGNYFLIKGKILDIRKEEFLFYADPIYNESFGYFYIKNDNPLPLKIEQTYFGINSQIILVAKFQNIGTYVLLRDLYTEINGEKKIFKGEEFKDIPIMESIVIYDLKDNEMINPFWVSKTVLELYDKNY